MLSHRGCAACKRCWKNLCCLTEGSERLHKEEASDEDEDTEFFDAMEDSPAFITVTATENTQHRSVAPTDSVNLRRVRRADVTLANVLVHVVYSQWSGLSLISERHFHFDHRCNLTDYSCLIFPEVQNLSLFLWGNLFFPGALVPPWRVMKAVSVRACQYWP